MKLVRQLAPGEPKKRSSGVDLFAAHVFFPFRLCSRGLKPRL